MGVTAKRRRFSCRLHDAKIVCIDCGLLSLLFLNSHTCSSPLALFHCSFVILQFTMSTQVQASVLHGAKDLRIVSITDCRRMKFPRDGHKSKEKLRCCDGCERHAEHIIVSYDACLAALPRTSPLEKLLAGGI